MFFFSFKKNNLLGLKLTFQTMKVPCSWISMIGVIQQDISGVIYKSS